MNQEVQAHIATMARLRQIVSDALGRSWDALPSYDRADLDRWLATAVPVSLAGQRQAVAITDAYLARALDRPPLGIDPDAATGAAVRNGTPPETVYERSFVTVWTALKNGDRYEDAVAAGRARAAGSGAMDVGLSMRGTLTAVQAGDDTITGYQRVADGRACDFCQAVDGAFVKSGDALPLHTWCGCSVAPLTGRVAATKAPRSVAVHQHGELGTYLAAADENFTGPSAVH